MFPKIKSHNFEITTQMSKGKTQMLVVLPHSLDTVMLNVGQKKFGCRITYAKGGQSARLIEEIESKVMVG